MLLQIVFENRKVNRIRNNDCLLSVDGVDCRVPNHGPDFASHKFAMKSGVRYELAVDILKANISWLNGPFPCGRWPDIKIFRQALIHQLDPNERVEADNGYVGEHPGKVKCPSGFANPQENEAMQQRIRNRQETLNKRFKQWEILNVPYRHELSTHGTVFRAIAVITQVAITNGEPLFSTEEYKDPK